MNWRLPLGLALVAPLAIFGGGAIKTNDIPFQAAVLGTPVVHGGYLYISADALFGGGLVVFDLSKPAAPVFAAGVRTAGPASGAPAFLGDTAYLPTEPGIEVIDVTRPEEPAHVRLLAPLSPRSSDATVQIVGERMVASHGERADCRLYDISDPFSPLLTDAAPLLAPLLNNPASSLLLAASFPHGATNLIFRIDSGRFVDCAPLPGAAATNAPDAVSIHFVTDKIAYLADGPEAVTVADFSDPRHPDVARCTNVPSFFLPPQGQRGRLYAAASNVLEVISVWKPLEPHRSRSIAFPPDVDITHLCINGDYAYFADNGSRTLRTFSIAGTNAVQTSVAPFKRTKEQYVLGEKSPISHAKDRAPGIALGPGGSSGETFRADIVVVDGLLIRSRGLPHARPTDLSVARLDNPLKEISVHQMVGTVHGFCADPASNRLFAADSLSIAVFRVADGALAEEARFPLSRHPLYGPRALALTDDGLIVAACGADGLRAYAYDGTNLNLRGTCETGGFACDVAVSGDRIFVADRERGVTVCRSADGQLEKIRTYALPRGTATAIAARNGIAYVAAGDVPLAILSDAPPISLATRQGGPSGAYALDIALLEHGDRLYALVADGRAGLSLYDVTNPKAPVFVRLLTAGEDSYTLFNSVSAVCTDGNLVYALDTCDGLIFGFRPFGE